MVVGACRSEGFGVRASGTSRLKEPPGYEGRSDFQGQGQGFLGIGNSALRLRTLKAQAKGSVPI